MRSHCTSRRHPPPGRTYYVDATGGGANSGNSEHAALQTVAHVNALALKPGDRVLFKRGETWSGTEMRPIGGGRAGRHVMFGAYDVGAAPIIQAGAAGETDHAIYIDKSFLTFRDLYCYYGTDVVVVNAATNVMFTNCTVEGDTTVLGCGITCYGTGLANIIIQGCTVFNNKVPAGGGAGITGTSINNLLIEGNTVYNNGTSSSLDHNIYFSVVDGYTCRNNVVYGAAAHGITMSGITNGVVEGNTSYSNTAGGIWVSGVNVGLTVKNNLVYSNTASGITLNTNASGATVLNNTVVASNVNINVRSGVTGCVIKNNISHAGATQNYGINVVSTTELGANVFNNNLYYRLSGSTKPCVINGTTWYTLAEWQALAGTPDLASVQNDPHFVTDYTDLHLQATSHAIAAGDATVGVTQDKDGVARGVAVDIGCFEYI